MPNSSMLTYWTKRLNEKQADLQKSNLSEQQTQLLTADIELIYTQYPELRDSGTINQSVKQPCPTCVDSICTNGCMV